MKNENLTKASYEQKKNGNDNKLTTVTLCSENINFENSAVITDDSTDLIILEPPIENNITVEQQVLDHTIHENIENSTQPENNNLDGKLLCYEAYYNDCKYYSL